MEKFKAKVRTSIWINTAAAAALLCVQILALTRTIVPVTADGHWSDMWNGFIMGAAFGIMALFIVGIILNLRALRNEKALKKLYAKENDERSKQIFIEARSTGTQIFLICGLAAGIVAGYFNVSVCITIIACVFAHSVICGILGIYYAKKY